MRDVAPAGIVASLLGELDRPAPPQFRLGLCRALELLGAPQPDREDQILAEVAAGTLARAQDVAAAKLRAEGR